MIKSLDKVVFVQSKTWNTSFQLRSSRTSLLVQSLDFPPLLCVL